MRAGLLSGGQQQMAILSCATIRSPRYLLLDEPSLGLAPIIVTQIYGFISAYARESGTTVIIAEQMASMALRVTDFGPRPTQRPHGAVRREQGPPRTRRRVAPVPPPTSERRPHQPQPPHRSFRCHIRTFPGSTRSQSSAAAPSAPPGAAWFLARGYRVRSWDPLAERGGHGAAHRARGLALVPCPGHCHRRRGGGARARNRLGRTRGGGRWRRLRPGERAGKC